MVTFIINSHPVMIPMVPAIVKMRQAISKNYDAVMRCHELRHPMPPDAILIRG